MFFQSVSGIQQQLLLFGYIYCYHTHKCLLINRHFNYNCGLLQIFTYVHILLCRSFCKICCLFM